MNTLINLMNGLLSSEQAPVQQPQYPVQAEPLPWSEELEQQELARLLANMPTTQEEILSQIYDQQPQELSPLMQMIQTSPDYDVQRQLDLAISNFVNPNTRQQGLAEMDDALAYSRLLSEQNPDVPMYYDLYQRDADRVRQIYDDYYRNEYGY